MTAVKADDDSGWADFASFDSNDSDSTFTSNKLTLSDSDNNGIKTVAKPRSGKTSPRAVLQDIFESTETDIQANSKLDSIPCLESRILGSRYAIILCIPDCLLRIMVLCSLHKRLKKEIEGE